MSRLTRKLGFSGGIVSEIEIKEIRKKDYEKAIQFAIKGMHFDWYLDNRFLLNALETKEKGKILYLYTDGACTYQFYEHRGFERVEEKEVVLEMPKGRVPLKCFVYSKKIHSNTG